MVGIERKGCFHFDLMSGTSTELHEDYVAEKLGFEEGQEDVVAIAKLLNMIRQIFAKPEKPKQCSHCDRTEPHIHCPECGSTEHVAETCDMEG